LTGYFESSTRRGQFNCTFFVSGKTSDSADRVVTWFPGDRDPREAIHGVLEQVSSGGKPAIRLKLEDEHGGCWNVQRFASDPSTFALTEQGSWESIRIVMSKKTYFYDDPSSPKPRKVAMVVMQIWEFKHAILGRAVQDANEAEMARHHYRLGGANCVLHGFLWQSRSRIKFVEDIDVYFLRDWILRWHALVCRFPSTIFCCTPSDQEV
jgi:hypothetical protein